MVFLVFLVFLEVLEMSSEVVGPGPNTREIKSLRVDPGPRACVQGLPFGRRVRTLALVKLGVF